MTLATLPGFSQRITARRRPPIDREIVIDSFAGAGGWGCGEEAANGWAVDVAINHDERAIAAHKVNHPATLHYMSDVFEIHPLSVEPGRRIAHTHFSPDCTHHSKARGAAPVSDRVRGLAWIVLAWAHHRRPRVITLENVEEFRDWGPTHNGKAIKSRKGETFKAFLAALSTGLSPDSPAMPEILNTLHGMMPVEALVKGLGFRVEHRELRACDYGAPTIRKRFFLIARSDEDAIVWPEPTHGPGREFPYHTAAECIDWSLPCPSIFMTPAECKAWFEATGQRVVRPLKPNTLKRIANGVRRYVLESAEPFIVSTNHGDSNGRREYPIGDPLRTVCGARGGEALITPYMVSIQNASNPHGAHAIDKPMPTITAMPKGGGHAVVAPYLVPRYGEREGQEPRSRSVTQPMPSVVPTGNGAALVAPVMVGAGGTTGTGRPRRVDRPLKTVKTEDRQALVSAFMVRHFGGMNARDVRLRAPTSTARATQNQIAGVHLTKFRERTAGQSIDEPAPTILSGGNHAALVYSFLTSYYGNSKEAASASNPLPTITKQDRFGLVTVEIGGEPYVITDIGMRMLQPHELLRAQFGELADGWVLLGNKTQQVAGIGNSVCPHVARAIVKANVKLRRVSRVEVA